ncbi:uncharacterized protein LOC144609015 isoform X2 [Rhinoraja longicauda]
MQQPRSSQRHHDTYVLLKSRRPFAVQAHELLCITPADTSKAAWLKTRWRDQWKSAEPSRLHRSSGEPTDIPGQDLPREQWITLDRLRTGVGALWSGDEEVGSRGQCPLRVWGPNTDGGAHSHQLPQIPPTEW